ncbi:hypothetical protein BN1723_000265 [Verticillium longisporum]|uniref:Uncharacterized protein n=1 Tax=Verticillium longisporum TaxID=100787 RepID=A0A0G4LEE8_VERLO|nr:hypothetical protein BN1723_000265 [Verticillium longisporum]
MPITHIITQPMPSTATTPTTNTTTTTTTHDTRTVSTANTSTSSIHKPTPSTPTLFTTSPLNSPRSTPPSVAFDSPTGDGIDGGIGSHVVAVVQLTVLKANNSSVQQMAQLTFKVASKIGRGAGLFGANAGYLLATKS